MGGIMSNEYNEDSVNLLRECSAGCKMAIDSMDHVKSHVEDKQLRLILDKYLDAHDKIENECQDLMREANIEDKDTNSIVQLFATMKSRIMLLMDNDKAEAASILTDGCGMGVKSLSEYINKYKQSDKKIMNIAHRLRDLEETMLGDLQPML